MHCWEFHHTSESLSEGWFWRSLDKNGRIHAECNGRFPTFMEAFTDAKQHGFDHEKHTWYLATPTHQPCMKVVEHPPRKRGGKKAA